MDALQPYKPYHKKDTEEKLDSRFRWEIRNSRIVMLKYDVYLVQHRTPTAQDAYSTELP